MESVDYISETQKIPYFGHFRQIEFPGERSGIAEIAISCTFKPKYPVDLIFNAKSETRLNYKYFKFS